MELTYTDYLQRLSVQDVLRDAGYVRNRKDGLRYPSFVRLDEKGQRIRGDKFIVTRDGAFCFHPPVQKNYNVISLIKEHPHLFPEYEVGMNLDRLVNKVCHRLLNTPYEERDVDIRESQLELRPFDLKDYRLHRIVSGDRDSAKPFYPFFKHRAIDLKTQFAFRDSFVLADHDLPGRKGLSMRRLSFPLTVPGGDGTVVGFEERGRPRHHAVANHQINMPSYRVVSTLPVPAVLRAAQSAQDGGYERPEHQAEDDDKDEGQSIFHNLEL